MKLNQKMKLTRIRNEIKDSAKYQLEDNDIKILSALQEGKTSIDITFVALGREFKDTYHLAKMVSSLIPSVYSDIDEFMINPNTVNYNRTLNGFFIRIIADIASLKFTEHKYGSVFDTDVCLTILFAMMYCSRDIQESLISKLSVLKAFKEKRNEQVRFFSTHTLLPMVKFFYELKYSEAKFSLDMNNIYDENGKLILNNNFDMNPLYKRVLNDYKTENEEVFIKLIDDLCEYHLKRSKDDYFLEFNNLSWQYFPVEILFLLKERHDLGLSIQGINHPLIDDFLPYFLNPFEISEQNQKILDLVLETVHNEQ